MMKFLNQYNDIMNAYIQGDFGDENLTMDEILNRAGAKDLLSNMSLNELQILINNSTHISKFIFKCKFEQKFKIISDLKKMEKELEQYKLGKYYSEGILNGSKLAKKLKLQVEYVSKNELSNDIEGTLEPCEKEEYNGTIKVLESSETKFPYIHEIIHYLRDVGVGNRVAETYNRKRKGETKEEKEQEIDYLTAAAVMPIEFIKRHLKEFEELEGEKEKSFITNISSIYEQDYDAVLRRFIEVRSLV